METQPTYSVLPKGKPAFARQLTRWFGQHGRDLPWRRTRDPYAILVSEFMLQQTQVAAVVDYFHRWMQRFPDWISLAAAEEQEVLACWQGLGYYARARNLHRAAKVVCDLHGGVLPADAETILTLPGVGRYTAGAVATFAFDLPEPIVDANIARVLARLHDMRQPVDSTAGSSAIWKMAADLVPSKNPGLFNSALMELGALVCVPRQPLCLACPVRKWCACLSGSGPEGLPVKKARRSTVHLVEDRALILRKGKILLQQETGKRWRGLWRLPDATPGLPLVAVVRYPITHHQITMQIRRVPAPPVPGPGQDWFTLADLHAVPMPAPHRRAVTAGAQ